MSAATDRIQRLYPWLPPYLVQVYEAQWAESGDSELAWAEVRAHPRYEEFFPGNRREDGTLRYSEAGYTSAMEGYRQVIESVGLNPDLFAGRYRELIEGDVSPDEFAAERVMPLYERVLEASPGIIQWYAEQNGLEMTFESILAARFDPQGVGARILNREIGLAEIGGEAYEAGFDIDLDLVESMYQRGATRVQAQQTFGKAKQFVPVLNVLASRHADPDDEFDLDEFVATDLFNDPIQRRRMSRLLAQERATFTGGGAGTFARNRQTGNVAGLNRPV